MDGRAKNAGSEAKLRERADGAVERLPPARAVAAELRRTWFAVDCVGRRRVPKEDGGVDVFSRRRSAGRRWFAGWRPLTHPPWNAGPNRRCGGYGAAADPAGARESLAPYRTPVGPIPIASTALPVPQGSKGTT